MCGFNYDLKRVSWRIMDVKLISSKLELARYIYWEKINEQHIPVGIPGNPGKLGAYSVLYPPPTKTQFAFDCFKLLIWLFCTSAIKSSSGTTDESVKILHNVKSQSPCPLVKMGPPHRSSFPNSLVNVITQEGSQTEFYLLLTIQVIEANGKGFFCLGGRICFWWVTFSLQTLQGHNSKSASSEPPRHPHSHELQLHVVKNTCMITEVVFLEESNSS